MKKIFLSIFVVTILFSKLSYAATPTLGTVTPASGNTTPNAAISFVCKYSDTTGWQDLKEANLLVNTSTTLTNTAYLYYDQNSGLLYLRNDANTAWLGGYKPGTSNVIENAQVKLNCASSTVSGSSTTMTVTFNVTFKTAYSGKTFNLYLAAKNDAGTSVTFSNKGTYTINSAPALGAVTPSSGTGTAGVQKIFTTTYTDSDGWQNIQLAYFLISTSSTALTNCFYGYYDQNANKLYLRNDANTAWLGGYAPGSANTIENSYAKIDCSTTTVTASTSTMTVSWAVTLKPAFKGSKSVYLSVKDDVNISVNLTSKGTWIVAVVNNPPQTSDVSPYVGASIPNQTFNFTTTYSDADGYSDIKSVYFLISPSSTSLTNCPYLYYDKSANKLYLRNDANTAWLGGYAPGSSNTIENSYAKLSCASTTVSGSGNILTVKWSIILKTAFLGTENTYLNVTDTAGLTSGWIQKGSWTALDSGTVIGPSGGQVSSPDGKVKLIIPAGAVTSPTAMSISPVSNDTLKTAAPQNSIMLSAVDCKPYGFVFNSLVSLVYTLSQAAVPGTTVQLGLYDSANKTLISMDSPSGISSDGYSVTFSIVHFSTYAAFENLISSGAAIGGGVKIPLPDMLTGAFGHAIPIAVSPGRKGMQPALALSYRSASGNSWVGLGFSLNPGYIVRSTRLGPPKYDDVQDTFYLVTDAGTMELVHLIDNLYQAKIESTFTKFYKETDNSWRALSKDGSVLRFGQTSDAREDATQGTFSWYLTKAIDTNGNYVAYSYTKDQGKNYLSRVDYTGNDIDVAPTNSVEFVLESREDVVPSYLSTSKISTAKRLKEIQVKANSQLVWRYVLDYSLSLDTNRSLLTSITQFASDGKSLPVQRMKYQSSGNAVQGTGN
ncbi:MAG: hypothetical protein HQL24_05540 [Candidatus Omnitrophica bacterium]|nr:hypothetical protein [Candidatus Omnitrophota bacterium]